MATRAPCIIAVIVLVLCVVYVQCQHPKDPAAEMLSKKMLKKLNQTGISAEMMSVKTKTAGPHPNKSATTTKPPHPKATVHKLAPHKPAVPKHAVPKPAVHKLKLPKQMVTKSPPHKPPVPKTTRPKPVVAKAPITKPPTLPKHTTTKATTHPSSTTKQPVPKTTAANFISRHVEDWTDFVTDLNGWVILGQWARYHLTFFSGDRPIPKIPSSVDQSVLICTVTKFPSTLTKQLVGLTNSFLTIVHYVSFQNDISIEGLISSDNNTEVFFALNKDDLYERNNNWISNTFRIPDHVKNMTIILQPRSSGDAKWAIGAIWINGTHISEKAKPAIIKPAKNATKKASPPTTNTTATPTTIKPPNTPLSNVTTAKNSTENPLHNTTGSVSKASSIHEDPLKHIKGVATAIWNAFYVFLALFCACMIALIVLIVKQR